MRVRCISTGHAKQIRPGWGRTAAKAFFPGHATRRAPCAPQARAEFVRPESRVGWAQAAELPGNQSREMARERTCALRGRGSAAAARPMTQGSALLVFLLEQVRGHCFDEQDLLADDGLFLQVRSSQSQILEIFPAEGL